MQVKTKASPGKVKAFLLIRDPVTNVPLFDDYDKEIPPEIAHALTAEDWEYINQQRQKG